jgi:hypothetical protein
VSTQLVASRVVLNSTELVSYINGIIILRADGLNLNEAFNAYLQDLGKESS